MKKIFTIVATATLLVTACGDKDSKKEGGAEGDMTICDCVEADISGEMTSKMEEKCGLLAAKLGEDVMTEMMKCEGYEKMMEEAVEGSGYDTYEDDELSDGPISAECEEWLAEYEEMVEKYMLLAEAAAEDPSNTELAEDAMDYMMKMQEFFSTEKAIECASNTQFNDKLMEIKSKVE